MLLWCFLRLFMVLLWCFLRLFLDKEICVFAFQNERSICVFACLCEYILCGQYVIYACVCINPQMYVCIHNACSREYVYVRGYVNSGACV